MTNKQAIDKIVFEAIEIPSVAESFVYKIREHCTDVMIFLAEDYENLKHLSAYELYDLFMQQEIEDVV